LASIAPAVVTSPAIQGSPASRITSQASSIYAWAPARSPAMKRWQASIARARATRSRSASLESVARSNGRSATACEYVKVVSGDL
jgi:hypothetical protein